MHSNFLLERQTLVVKFASVRFALCGKKKRCQAVHNIKVATPASVLQHSLECFSKSGTLTQACVHSGDFVGLLAQSRFPVQHVSTLTRTVWLLCTCLQHCVDACSPVLTLCYICYREMITQRHLVSVKRLVFFRIGVHCFHRKKRQNITFFVIFLLSQLSLIH